MKQDPGRSLKSLNMKWLVMLASLDVFVVLLFAAPEFIEDAAWSSVVVVRGLVTALIPVFVLLLTGLLPHNIKAILVYWKVRNPLPGCQAFTRHAPSDIRVDMVALEKNVGELPTDAAEQNKKWFKLYRMVSDDKTVVESHRMYLLYRDMAAMSLPLIALIPMGLHFMGASASTLWISAGLVATQFGVCCLCARSSGIRLVCNVLAIHSTIELTTPNWASSD
jgi:hypothetical protein